MKYTILIAFLFLANGAAAQPGRIDKYFGGQARIRTDFFNRSDYLTALALQSDGKIIAAGGSSNTQLTSDIAVARYFSNGILDSSFGTDGRFLSGLDKRHYDCSSVVIQKDDKIVLAGSVRDTTSYLTNVFIHRLNANGTTDTNFGNFGEITLHILHSQINIFKSSILQPDGKILIAGYAEDSSDNGSYTATIVLARYTQNGLLDASFGKAGIITNDFKPNTYDAVLSIALQSDGKILAGGYTAISSNPYKFTLRRYNINGTPDVLFGTKGEIIQDSMEGGALSLLLRPNGKILASFGGYWSGDFIQILQFTPDGKFDSTFGLNGIAFVMIPSSPGVGYISSGANVLLLRSSGKFFAIAPSASSAFFLFSFNSNGTVDSTFQQNGEERFDENNYDENWGIQAAILQGSDKILIGGTVSYPNNYSLDFGLRRLDLNGNIDGAFSFLPTLVKTKNPGNDEANTIVIRSTEQIFLGGYSDNDTSLIATQYLADGEIDRYFALNGKLYSTNYPNKITINGSLEKSGYLIVAGQSYNDTNFVVDFTIADFNGDGLNVIATTDFGNGLNYCQSALLQPDEKIVASGYAFTHRNYDFALARYTKDGIPDSSFGTTGKVTTDIGINQDYAYASALQSDGKIVLCGTTYNDKQWQIALIRYNSDGSLDHSFGSSGIVLTALHDSDDEAKSIAIQSDGKIVVAGYTRVNKNYNFALVRYNMNGHLDSTFGKYGVVETSIGSGDAEANGIVIDKIGRIVAVGYSSNGKDDDFTLACYHANGSLDKNFGAGGITTTDFGYGNDHGNAVALQSDGAIVVAGYAFNGTDKDYAVARYLPDLSLGVIDRKPPQNITTIYPNPIRNSAVLQYELTQSQPITIKLFDVLGNERAVFINNEIRSEGKNTEQIIFPSGIPVGSYYMRIETKEGNVSVNVIKSEP